MCAGAQIDQFPPQIFRDDDLSCCPSSHTAKAAFRHMNRCCSLAENTNIFLGLSAGAARPLTLTACLCWNETALSNSLMVLKAFKTACVSSSYQSFLLFIFYKLNNQDKATFPYFLSCSISFLLRSFHSASRTLFAFLQA